MKIIIADNKKISEKIINENNNLVTFEYYDTVDYFSFKYIDENKIFLDNSEMNFENITTSSIELIINSCIEIKSKYDGIVYYIYLLPDLDYNYKKINLKTNNIIIGSNNLGMCNLLIKELNLKTNNINIKINEDKITVNNESDYNIYINNSIMKVDSIKYGDLIFINGIFILFVSKVMYIFYLNENIAFDRKLYKEENKEKINLDNYKEINFIKYNKNSTFHPSAVIKKEIVQKTFNIDPPSTVELKESNPLILTMMPMLLMSSTSIIMSFNIINNIKAGKSTWKDNSISLIFSAVMIFTMILYPIIQNIYKKHRESKREIKRIEEYKDYIYENKLKILKEIEEQKEILLNNFKDTKSCVEIFESNIEQIWDKKRGDNDFLVVSLGKGRYYPKLNINYPQEHFTIDRDKLRIQITKLKESVEYIDDSPILINLYKNNNISFVGNSTLVYNFISSLLIRLFYSHSYTDVRFCVFSDESKKNYWDEYSSLPYFWNNEKNLRFFVYNSSSMSGVVNYLDLVYKERLQKKELEKNDLNYVILIDNIKIIKDIVFLKEILTSDKNFGFTIIFLSDSMNALPSYCKDFIKLNNNGQSSLIIKDNNYKEVDFTPDLYNIDFQHIYRKLSGLYNYESINKMPSKVTFLEMYNVDGVEKLNVTDNWNNNNSLENMSVPIGVNEHGEIINLDLHENAHGPHGLIAGMTGSGKSEFIISLILSLSINYSPLDVQFVLIDYKGGGLSNTFYSNDLQKRLPHIVGVITNISESEINRCLISLESEMKRRQILFSDVSIKYNEGNIDIYKYQQLAKTNKDIEYLSHLVIISDEFAELKTQNPEFIEKLVSLARIGRSLGIHLILSTQKPSGVVDSQIWSNSKFKICLKVQDKSDSKEVIGVDDAVYLTNPGRFYMQIGYNELFLKGQSAHSGAPYYLLEKNSKMSEYKLDFINECGKTYYSYSFIVPDINSINGTHASNIVSYIIQKSDEFNYNIKPLWKDSLKEKIYLDDLLKKYNYIKNDDVEIIFGEYDEVDKQRKGLARYSLVNKGNIILYGNTGSGKSELIHSSLYFLIKNYTAEEINIYIMDYSTESTKIFEKASQVGDVMYLQEKEKIVNTFKYLTSILDERKNILASYGGNFIKYNQENSNKLPVILLIISNLERLFENFNELENIFIDLTRDCNKFGITFMVAVNSSNGVRNRLITSFQQIIALELKDKYEYDSLFGCKVKYKLPNILGRGFVKIENVYEMQTALISPKEDMYEYLENAVNKLSLRQNVKAPKIPILPDVVTYDIIKNYLVDNKKLPVGIDIETLDIVNFEFNSKEGLIISGNDMDLIDKYMNSLIKNINYFENNKLFIFDDEDSNIDIGRGVLIKSDYAKYISQLFNFVESFDNKYHYFVVFKSLASLLDKLQLKEKALLYELLEKLRLNNNFNLILVDIVSAIKKYEYNDFYTSNFSNNKGLFIGDGIFEQYIIKVNKIPRKYRDIQDESFGYCVENNKLKCIKVLEYNKYD